MLVKDWMTKKVITITEEQNMIDAISLMNNLRIHMLPVMDKENHLVGIITDRDIKRASASDASSLETHELIYLISKIKVKQIMTKDPITVPPDFTIEETAEVLLENSISGVPVVENEHIIGIITKSDIFKVLISMTGIAKKGILFAFTLEDSPNALKDVLDIFRQYQGRVATILRKYDATIEKSSLVYLRIYDIDRDKLKEIKQKLQEKVTMHYMIDYRFNVREVYS